MDGLVVVVFIEYLHLIGLCKLIFLVTRRWKLMNQAHVCLCVCVCVCVRVQNSRVPWKNSDNPPPCQCWNVLLPWTRHVKTVRAFIVQAQVNSGLLSHLSKDAMGVHLTKMEGNIRRNKEKPRESLSLRSPRRSRNWCRDTGDTESPTTNPNTIMNNFTIAGWS